ncbi:hypothetical protein ACIBI9_18775 [Nonomuraea sp. NPDC050451]|uniref:hypothetical protein n=1 Tax=Nonomuraea sp. NPDC050451 TaxID=3364364 RepID=UPI0037BB06C7
MAWRSWTCSRSGTRTGTPPATVVRIGYASNERHPKTTSPPGSHTVCRTCPQTSDEPAPTAMRSGVTSWRAASASSRRAAPMSVR